MADLKVSEPGNERNAGFLKCSICHAVKAAEEFGLRRSRPKGRKSECRECRSKIRSRPRPAGIQLLIGEEWRPVVGYEGLYEVSSAGRVRSLDIIHLTRNAHGEMTRKRPGRLLAAIPTSGGYRRVRLSVNGIAVDTLIHQIVASAFIGPCPAGKEVNHKDLKKTNNHDTNLEYVTKLENARHARQNGAIDVPCGERHYRAKLRRTQVEDIICRTAAGESHGIIASEYGVSRSAVTGISRGVSWKHVPRSKPTR